MKRSFNNTAVELIVSRDRFFDFHVHKSMKIEPLKPLLSSIVCSYVRYQFKSIVTDTRMIRPVR